MKKRGKRGNPHIGESFDSFLKAEGIYESVTTTAIKRTLAKQLEKAMKQQRLTKAQMARRMKSSRTQLDRLLDPENDDILRRFVALQSLSPGFWKEMPNTVRPGLNPAIDVLRR